MWWRFDSVSRAMGSHSSRTQVRHTQLANRGPSADGLDKTLNRDARVGLARLSPVEYTLRRSDSCVSIHPTEGAPILWGGRRVRAWWVALQSRFDTDDQPGGAIEIAMTIALIAVVVVAALLLVVTQLSGR